MFQTDAMGGGNDNQWFVVICATGWAQRQGTPIHGTMSAGKAGRHCNPGLSGVQRF